MIFSVIHFTHRALRTCKLLTVVLIGFVLIDSGNLFGQSGQRNASSSSKLQLNLTENSTAEFEVVPDLPLESGPEIVSVSDELTTFEPPVDVATSDCSPCNSCDQSGSSSLFPDQSVARIAVVKNRHLFGDPDKCCDEWKGFCKMKKLSTDCPCGGLKAKRGHLGLSSLRSSDAGEDCDYCRGGCCKSGGCKPQTNREIRRNVFADAIANWPRFRRDCTCPGGQCGNKEECNSCQ